MKSNNGFIRGGLAAGLAFSLVACGAEGSTGGAHEAPSASPSATAREMAKVAVRLQLDPNQTVLDRLDPEDKAASGGELDLHVLKGYKNEDGACSDTAIKLTLDRELIPAQRGPEDSVDLTVDLPVGDEIN